MELSSKIKSMKFMKRKDEAAQRQETEAQAQKSVERTHWTVDASLTGSSASPASTRPKFAVEYDLSTSTSAIAARQSYQSQKQTQDTGNTSTQTAGKAESGTTKQA